MDPELSFREHISDKITKAYQMIGIMNRNFKDLDRDSFMVIYKSLVRSHLEYGNSVWNPHHTLLVADIEKVQKRVTKLVKGLRKLSYRERLVHLQLPTLKFRRIRGDEIEVFKIVTGKYDAQVTPLLPLSENVRTRGHSYKLLTKRTKYDLRKYSFSCRVVRLWNSLPEEVVTACSVNSFKNKLDDLWKQKEIYFNYKAELNLE